MKRLFFMCVACFVSLSVVAQIRSGEITPNGIVYPRFATAQLPTTAIVGTVIFNTTLNVHQYWNGTAWQNISAGGGGSSPWITSGSNIYVNSNNKVGINTPTPLAALTVNPHVNTTVTNAVFGVGSTGISLQQNYPTIGFNQYRDDNNNAIRMADGSTMNHYFFPAAGEAYWNITPSGLAGGQATPEINLMRLGINGTFQVGVLASASIGSIAMGNNSETGSSQAAAIGYGAQAMGTNSYAFGTYARAMQTDAIALGRNTLSNQGSAAIGSYASAQGIYAYAIGNTASATVAGAKVFGTGAQATGINSMALGNWVNTNGNRGALIIGDDDPYGQGPTVGGFANEFVARFAGGYYFMTCGDTGNGNPSNGVRTGVQIGPKGNSWSSISDSTKKEKFLPTNGEEMLRKVAKLKAVTWNYKGQDPKTFRHYGPMAQEFFSAFGRDAYGTIGNDTTLASADVDGVLFVLVQALAKRTEELKVKNEDMRVKNEELRVMNREAIGRIQESEAKSQQLSHENERLKQKIATMEATQQQQWATLKDEIAELKNTISTKPTVTVATIK